MVFLFPCVTIPKFLHQRGNLKLENMKKSGLYILAILFSISFSYGQNKAIQSEVMGKGEPVLFLPGFTTPGSIWKKTIEHFTVKKESHLISYAGFNGLQPIEMPWYASIKKELIEYIKKHDLKNLNIIGHSMGGTLAIDLAATIPNVVNKIILVDALPCMREVMMPGVPAKNIQYKNPYNTRMLEMNTDDFKAMAHTMAVNMTANKDKVETVKKWIVEADRKTYVYGYTDLLKLDLRSSLSKIKAKVLILVAPTYGAASKKTMENQYTQLKNNSIELAPSGKHFIMFDEPQWFYKKVNAFLTSE